MKRQPELVLADEGIPEALIDQAKHIIQLLRTVTSISVVSEFLKSKELHFSGGSWEEIEEKRIIPALRSRTVSIKDLCKLLADAEEFGRNHTFLYMCGKKDIGRLVDRERIVRTCARLGLSRVLEEPQIEELPESPTITEVREEGINGSQAWIFKVVETRDYKRFSGESTIGDTFRREWKIESVRAVNVARLHSSGLLEIRIQSHANNSTNYDSQLSQIWTMLNEFLPPTQFSSLSLRKAKDRLWDDREALKKKVRFSDSTMTNDIGTTIVASTGGESGDLFNDSACTASLDQFLGRGAHCDSSNIWFRSIEGVIPRDVHVLLSGMNNEFAVPASCTRVEYEYVLNELRAYNK